jgi:hypothetical protein
VVDVDVVVDVEPALPPDAGVEDPVAAVVDVEEVDQNPGGSVEVVVGAGDWGGRVVEVGDGVDQNPGGSVVDVGAAAHPDEEVVAVLAPDGPGVGVDLDLPGAGVVLGLRGAGVVLDLAGPVVDVEWTAAAEGVAEPAASATPARGKRATMTNSGRRLRRRIIPRPTLYELVIPALPVGLLATF